MAKYGVHWREDTRGHTRSLPGLSPLVSIGSEDDEGGDEEEIPYDESKDEQPSLLTHRAVDVRPCRSETCCACQRPTYPVFVRSTHVAPSHLRCLPAQWWKSDHVPESLTDRLPRFIIWRCAMAALVDSDDDDETVPFDEV